MFPRFRPRVAGLSLVAFVLSAIAVAPGRANDTPSAPAAGQKSAGPPPETPEHAKLRRRMQEAIARTKNMSVVYQDILGEGPGHWDPGPRYPDKEVNCITWLQLLVAETYGDTPQEKQAVLDSVRYYNRHVGYGLRKHYTDQWMEIEPGPLHRIDFSQCPYSSLQRYHLDLEPAKFTSSVKYACPLYHQSRTSIDLELIPPQGLVLCSAGLQPGYYVFFPVASDRYLAKYGGFSGPMGQVHAVVLEVPAATGGDRDPAKFKVYHASIARGKVVETELGSYVLNMWNLYRGYQLYELDPSWTVGAEPALDDEAKGVLACEKKLKATKGQVFEHEASRNTSH
jgi:hypothetical protein